MAPKGKGENTKKAAGNAKKAEVAAQKKAVENANKEVAEQKKWQQGAKDNSKACETPEQPNVMVKVLILYFPRQ